jgi:hypothetical protein
MFLEACKVNLGANSDEALCDLLLDSLVLNRAVNLNECFVEVREVIEGRDQQVFNENNALHLAQSVLHQDVLACTFLDS